MILELLIVGGTLCSITEMSLRFARRIDRDRSALTPEGRLAKQYEDTLRVLMERRDYWQKIAASIDQPHHMREQAREELTLVQKELLALTCASGNGHD